MSVSKVTPNLKLPDFQFNDRGTWDGDLAGAMRTLDTAYGGLKTDVGGVTENVTSLSQEVAAQKVLVDQFGNRLTCMQNVVGTHSQNILDINNEITQIKEEISGGGSIPEGLEERIAALEAGASATSQLINAMQTQITSNLSLYESGLKVVTYSYDAAKMAVQRFGVNISGSYQYTAANSSSLTFVILTNNGIKTGGVYFGFITLKCSVVNPPVANYALARFEIELIAVDPILESAKISNVFMGSDYSIHANNQISTSACTWNPPTFRTTNTATITSATTNNGFTYCYPVVYTF